MNRDDMKTSVLRLLASPSYMPMRKRGLAKELDIDDEDYRNFKELLDAMAGDGTIAELKKGKWGLPLGGTDARVPAHSVEDNSESDAPVKAPFAAKW